MNFAAASAPDIVFLFAGAGLVLYIAARAAVDAVTSVSDPSPGKLALAHWMTIAWTAILAAVIGRIDIALAIAFATCVAAIGLGLGTLLLVAPHPQITPVHPTVWPFIVPAALLALLAGFRSVLTWWHAVMMLALGAAIVRVWISEHPVQENPFKVSINMPRHRAWQLYLAIALGGVGAWLALQATRVADDRTRIATGGLIAAAIVAPLLVLPLLGSGAFAAQNNRTGSAMAGIVGIILLNLCLLVPLIVLTAYLRELSIAWYSDVREVNALRERLKPVGFPYTVWRVDTILILLGGLLLVPVSLGRWTLAKAEGSALILCYVAYMLVSVVISRRI